MNTPAAPLRVAFIGGGSMARAHARALGKLGSDAQIVGVFDADQATAEEFAATFATRAFASVASLLSSLHPDVVHVCTTAGAHFEAARQALLAGAHVYIEKPFVETLSDANTLLTIAEARDRLVCAGHQLLGDPAYEELLDRAQRLRPFARVESLLSFASPTVHHDAPPRARIAQLLDVVPHPLYTLVAALERLAPGAPMTLTACSAAPDAVESLIDAGSVHGRLHVSLLARPVASTLSISGGNGTLAADFIRGCVTGVVNPGTSPIEKILNPVIEGASLGVRSLAGVARRFTTHGEYPGLVPLIQRFYAAIRGRTASPTPADHLRRVVALYEQIAAAVRASSPPARAMSSGPSRTRIGPDAPVVVVTGASGFLGRPLTRALAERGFRVRGLGRGADPQQDGIHEWIRTDLSRRIPPEAFKDVYAVVHAAAATRGGMSAHQRDSVESAGRVVDAMAAAGVSRLVHVSSISVVRPPRRYGEVQSESTQPAEQPQTLGPYTWGKCASEKLVVDRAASARIAVRVIRPGALTDRRAPELPGLAGRRLFGTWHLFLGRPSLAIATCDVEIAAEAIAWSVASFDEAPPVVNLIDPTVTTRAALIRRMREDGWRGRGIWVPISFLAAAVTVTQRALSVARGRRGQRLDVWQVLRPRQFDTAVSARVLAAMRKPEAELSRPPNGQHLGEHPDVRAAEVAAVSGARV